MGCGGTKGISTPGGSASGSHHGSGPETENLLDKYTLGKVLGQGAFGVVYSCKRKDSKQEFAVKMIDKVESPLADIRREEEMLKKLAHPCVVKLHDVYYEKVFVYMVFDLYKGGDMIAGMQSHWQNKGQIIIPAVQRVGKQMLEGITWLHGKDVVHRDVKGDNYLMDRKDIADPECRIFLSDFGTVCDLPPGQRLNNSCGTKIYWSPEFYKLSYGLKVDCWAVGVVMFGLVTGRFPFKGQEDVNTKTVKLPRPRTPKEGEELITGLLTKSEEKRLTAAQAKDHPWLASIPSVASEIEEMDFKPDIKEQGANGGVADRRRQLVERLENARDNTVLKPASQIKGTFEVIDKYADRTVRYEWWPAKKVVDMGLLNEQGLKQETPEDIKLNVDRNTPGIIQMLTDHIDMSKFGQGTAKTADDLVHECQIGASQLMLDATTHKKVVRVVDIVLLRLVSKDKKILVQTSEKHQDRERNISQIPGTKKLPHENLSQVAKRVISDRLQMGTDCKVTLNPSSIESYEEEENSPSYPGLQTVYRKQIVEATAEVLGTKQSGAFKSTDQGITYSWTWLSEKACQQKNVKLRAPAKTGDISALVPAPVGFKQEELEEYLSKSGVDINKFGENNTKTLQEFSEELTKGEATLTRRNDGKVIRVVDVVVLKLAKSGGDLLVEVEETNHGVKKVLNRLPAVKRRSDENQFYSAQRVLSSVLKVDPNGITLNHTNVGIGEEEKDSPSYPGLASAYRKRIINAEVSG
mmetsp:Transcript_28033/g.61208  ORF Transcript_28033/g.61208 Transcript_28033/m.61208 type:complete len:750 (-) Transcript_28033:137-2386(-)